MVLDRLLGGYRRRRIPGTREFVYLRPNTSDEAAFDYIFGGAYELELPFKPRLIVDLGANVGFASVSLALRYPDARVIAVEPEGSNVALLRRNAKRFPQVEVVHAAAWPESAKLAIDDVGKGFWGMRIRPSAVGGVRGVTMPELAGPDEQIDVLKVDIEGSELDLFGRRTEWLGRVRVLVIELHDRFRPGCRDAVAAALERSGRGFREQAAGEDAIFVRNDAYEHAAPAERSNTRQTP